MAPDEAFQTGFINKVVDGSELEAAAVDLALATRQPAAGV
jgi:enoyl-CoA hydratase/carnithine racemase